MMLAYDTRAVRRSIDVAELFDYRFDPRVHRRALRYVQLSEQETLSRILERVGHVIECGLVDIAYGYAGASRIYNLGCGQSNTAGTATQSDDLKNVRSVLESRKDAMDADLALQIVVTPHI